MPEGLPEAEGKIGTVTSSYCKFCHSWPCLAVAACCRLVPASAAAGGAVPGRVHAPCSHCILKVKLLALGRAQQQRQSPIGALARCFSLRQNPRPCMSHERLPYTRSRAAAVEPQTIRTDLGLSSWKRKQPTVPTPPSPLSSPFRAAPREPIGIMPQGAGHPNTQKAPPKPRPESLCACTTSTLSTSLVAVTGRGRTRAL